MAQTVKSWYSLVKRLLRWTMVHHASMVQLWSCDDRDCQMFVKSWPKRNQLSSFDFRKTFPYWAV